MLNAVVLLKIIIFLLAFVILMSRRVRTDLESRDFHCPCGRSYLSYSALHTHIRKYHRVEDNMLERAVLPQRTQHRRGRPRDRQASYISQELEDLTLYETTVLGIYQEVQPLEQTPILLEGDEDFDEQAHTREFQHLLHKEGSRFSELASEKTMRECEGNMQGAVSAISKHLKAPISARVRLMLSVGYLELYLNSAPKEECMARMESCSWRGASTRLSQLLYDVLMRALQRHPHPQMLLTSNDE